MSYVIQQGDALEVLKRIPDEKVQCVVTSPPYFGLRDYGVDGQIGLEGTPQEFIGKLVEIFREVRRILKPDGTCWVNLGDSYGATGGDTHSNFNARWNGTGGEGSKQNSMLDGVKGRNIETNVKPKNLLGIPWRFAFAAQDDGWYLRQDIIWHKPNPIPESVRDRCTKAHEYVFLLTKSAKYYFDAEAIKTPVSPKTLTVKTTPYKGKGTESTGGKLNKWMTENGGRYHPKTANKRSVWTVATKPYKEAHFATFPETLVEPMVLAGSREGDCVLDPFSGAATTGLVAIKNKRHYIGIELNQAYIDISHKRLDGIS